MQQIHIEHVIFTRVEKAFSPRGTSGYQVVYHSPDLAPDVIQIEKSIQCFQTNKQQLTRHQFFWTARGQAVLTKSISLLSPDREVIDRDQRDAFLVHALVLAREDFALARNDPFAIFEAAESLHLFTAQVPQLVRYIKTAETPPAQLSVQARTLAPTMLKNTKQEELLQLYRLAEAAPTLNEQKKSLLMIAADPEEIYRLLRALVFLLPAHERTLCTFDTYVDSCTPAPGAFWAVGSTKGLNNPNFLPMRLAEHQIVSLGIAPRKSLYSTWFVSALQASQDFGRFNEELYSAQLVAEAFNAHQAMPEDLPSPQVLYTYRELFSSTIDANLYKILAAVMEKSLAEAIVPQLYTYLSLPMVLTIASQGTLSNQVLARVVYSWFTQKLPAWKEWDNVLGFASTSGYAPLLLLASLKARPRLFKSHEKIQVRALHTIQEAGRLPQLLVDLSASELVPAPTSASPAGPEPPARQFVLSDEEFHMLVNLLLEQKMGHLIQSPCIQRVASLQEKKIVVALAKVATASKSVTPEFLQALQQHPLSGK